MTKNYQIKTYLIDSMGYSFEVLEGLPTECLLRMIDDIKECAKFLDVPISYLK